MLDDAYPYLIVFMCGIGAGVIVTKLWQTQWFPEEAWIHPESQERF